MQAGTKLQWNQGKGLVGWGGGCADLVLASPRETFSVCAMKQGWALCKPPAFFPCEEVSDSGWALNSMFNSGTWNVLFMLHVVAVQWGLKGVQFRVGVGEGEEEIHLLKFLFISTKILAAWPVTGISYIGNTCIYACMWATPPPAHYAFC